jgi:hypothetical protein
MTELAKPDAKLRFDLGSICLLQPLTDAAREWLDEHVDPDAQWLGPSLAIEARYVEPIVEGMRAEGLLVE